MRVMRVFPNMRSHASERMFGLSSPSDYFFLLGFFGLGCFLPILAGAPALPTANGLETKEIVRFGFTAAVSWRLYAYHPAFIALPGNLASGLKYAWALPVTV